MRIKFQLKWSLCSKVPHYCMD